MCEKAKCENALAVSFIAAIDPDDVEKVSIHFQIRSFPVFSCSFDSQVPSGNLTAITPSIFILTP